MEGEDKPQTVIAGFFDILGFSNLIDESLNNWQLALKKIKMIEGMIETYFQTRGRPEIFVRIFSDNIYISYPILINEELRF